MGLSFGKRDGSGRVANIWGRARQRPSARKCPQCEAMEPRRLLSTASAPAAGYLSPGTAEVAKAQSVMSSGASQAFQNYAADLQRLEQSSGVTPAQFKNLANDTAQLVQNIETANESTTPESPQELDQQYITIQNVVDQSFVAGSYGKTGWAQLQTELSAALNGVTFSTNLPQVTFVQMEKVARAAHVTRTENQQLVADEQALGNALGPHVDSDLGGTEPRDPVVVYYDGQVNQFAHKR
jgi:hypothetical protein